MQRPSIAAWGCAALFAAFAASAQQPPGQPPEPTTPPAPPAPKEPIFALRGFVSASMYVADANFAVGNGQNALWVQNEFTTDKIHLGGDVRQTRLNFSVTAPAKILGGATPRGVVEIDFFGGNSAGAFGVWLFGGTDKANEDDVRAAQAATVNPAARLLANSRFQNVRLTPMLRYLEGPYVVGLEWDHFHTKWTTSGSLDGNQVILSFNYNL